MRRPRGWIGLGLLTAGLAWLATGITLVAPGEVVVVRRFGRALEPVWTAGLHWGLPGGLDRRERIRVDEIQRLEIGRAPEGPDREAPESAEFLIGDRNFVRIGATVQYRVADPVVYSQRPRKALALLHSLAESSLCRALASRSIDGVLRDERAAVAATVASDLSRASESCGLGIAILGVILTDARPPVEVQAAFEDAQAASSGRERRIQEAESYAQALRPTTAAQAQAAIDAASALSARVLGQALARAERFNALVEEARRDPVQTRRRLYRDRLATLLPRLGRKVIVPAGDAVDLSLLGFGGPLTPLPTTLAAPASGPASTAPTQEAPAR